MRDWTPVGEKRNLGAVPPASMITVIALTQFAFIALGLMAVKIIYMAHSTTATLFGYTLFLDRYGFWLFIIPFLWMFYAQSSIMLKRSIFQPKIARAVGIGISVLVVLLFLTVTLYPSR
jgi:hypothetical protein